MVLVLVGTITALAGLVFNLQGQGLLGPSSGFMFRNPTWVTQGELVMVVGVVLVLAALALRRQGSAEAKS